MEENPSKPRQEGNGNPGPFRSYSKKSLGYLEGWLSVGINIALFVLKYWAGRRIGSVAMLADAWHTLSDLLTSAVVIVCFWISARPADEKHHFGHGRAEPIASIIIGTLLAVVGFGFLKESISRLAHHQAVDFQLFAVLIFLASLFIKEALARFAIWAGRKTNSRSLIADGWHHRSDAIASGLIVAGALVGKYFWWMDGVLGIGVSLLILHATYGILRNSASYLIGEAPNKDLEARINEAIRRVDPTLNDLHHLHVHEYGDHLEITAHIRIDGVTSLDEAHALATRIEAIVRGEVKAEVTIHVEPLP
jgi:cation diffusion facilitator family transporter